MVLKLKTFKVPLSNSSSFDIGLKSDGFPIDFQLELQQSISVKIA